jgi:hypothetical protein
MPDLEYIVKIRPDISDHTSGIAADVNGRFMFIPFHDIHNFVAWIESDIKDLVVQAEVRRKIE